MAVRPPILDNNILSVDEALFSQTAAESSDQV
jgi:hypothetical protein